MQQKNKESRGKDMIKIAVLGYGTVGSGVVEVIEKNKDMVNKKAGEELSIKYILDLRDFPGDPYENKVVHDYQTIVNDPEIQIICETMGGTGAAYEFTKQALQVGKSVCKSLLRHTDRSFLPWQRNINVIICSRPVWAAVFPLSDP